MGSFAFPPREAPKKTLKTQTLWSNSAITLGGCWMEKPHQSKSCWWLIGGISQNICPIGESWNTLPKHNHCSRHLGYTNSNSNKLFFTYSRWSQQEPASCWQTQTFILVPITVPQSMLLGVLPKYERMCESLSFQTGSVGQICHDTSNFLERPHWPGRISSLSLVCQNICVNCVLRIISNKNKKTIKLFHVWRIIPRMMPYGHLWWAHLGIEKVKVSRFQGH